MAIYSGFSHEKLWFSIAMLVYQRVHKMDIRLDQIRWCVRNVRGLFLSQMHRGGSNIVQFHTKINLHWITWSCANSVYIHVCIRVFYFCGPYILTSHFFNSAWMLKRIQLQYSTASGKIVYSDATTKTMPALSEFTRLLFEKPLRRLRRLSPSLRKLTAQAAPFLPRVLSRFKDQNEMHKMGVGVSTSSIQIVKKSSTTAKSGVGSHRGTRILSFWTASCLGGIPIGPSVDGDEHHIQ